MILSTLSNTRKSIKNIINVGKILQEKKIIEEDTFEDLQDTYEFSKNHDYERDKDDFEMEI